MLLRSDRSDVGSLDAVAPEELDHEHAERSYYPLLRPDDLRLKLREGLRYRWHTGTARLLSDDDPRERQRWLASQLPSSAGNARAVRLFGTQLLTIRIDLDD